MFAAKRGGDETRFVKARICCGWINVEGFAGERAHSVCGMARISVSCGERLIGRTWSRRHAGKTPTLAGRSSFPRSPARRGKFPDGQNAPKPCFFATRQNTARYSAAPLPAGQTASNAHTGSAPCPAGQGSVARNRRFLPLATGWHAAARESQTRPVRAWGAARTLPRRGKQRRPDKPALISPP